MLFLLCLSYDSVKIKQAMETLKALKQGGVKMNQYECMASYGSWKEFGECCGDHGDDLYCASMKQACDALYKVDDCGNYAGCEEATEMCDEVCKGAGWDFCPSGGIAIWVIIVIVVVVVVVAVVVALLVYFLWYKPKKEKEIQDGAAGVPKPQPEPGHP
jgi:hypothetical protein